MKITAKLTIMSALLVSGLVSGAVFAGENERIEISQKDRRFQPDAINISTGATIAVLNDDRFTHHVFYEQDGREFDSGEQPPGKTVEIALSKPGEYALKCAIHPKMRLDVTVEE